jgi:hypothetical protein
MKTLAGFCDATSLGYSGQEAEVANFELYIHAMRIVHLFGRNKQ